MWVKAKRRRTLDEIPRLYHSTVRSCSIVGERGAGLKLGGNSRAAKEIANNLLTASAEELQGSFRSDIQGSIYILP